jgi:hypothetical protein
MLVGLNLAKRHLQTFADGSTNHGFPWKTESIFTLTFENDKILSTDEFANPVTVGASLFNETVAVQAQVNC